MKGFIRQEDAINRLNGTLCFYKGEPVYVTVSPDFPVNTVMVQSFKSYVLGQSNRRSNPIMITDDAFDAVPRPLGYVNYGGVGLFIGRLPERRPKQGLSPDAITVVGSNTAGFQGRHIFATPEFLAMINNEYPSLEQSKLLIEEGRQSCAFSRTLCVGYVDGRNILGLMYRGRMVGLYNSRTDSFSLLPGSKEEKLLRFHLDKHGVKQS